MLISDDWESSIDYQNMYILKHMLDEASPTPVADIRIVKHKLGLTGFLLSPPPTQPTHFFVSNKNYGKNKTVLLHYSGID